MRICEECNQEHHGWCKPCNSKHFKNNFDKWTSGNEKIDKFIQDAQLYANGWWKVIEWIPYDRFSDTKEIAKGGFGTIYYANWIGGRIDKWDIENQQWKRWGQREVVLKKFDNFANLNEEFLNEMVIHLKTMNHLSYSIRIYGITKDPENNKYMIVFEYMPDGNFRDYLKNHFDNINWNNKLRYLRLLAHYFRYFHNLDIVHQDFHPGNILSYDYNYGNLYISDFGLSKIVGQNIENPHNKNIFGVLPYISPEVLCGEEYTKAADVYSFGIIAYELITGFAPYYDVPHDRDLARQICNGLRPKIPFHTPKIITGIIMRCWDARVTHRPTFEELDEEFSKYHRDYWENNYQNVNEITIQIDNAEKISKLLTNTTTINPYNYQTHPEAIFTSRLLNYSSLPKFKNDENFEKELEETINYTSASNVSIEKSISERIPCSFKLYGIFIGIGFICCIKSARAENIDAMYNVGCCYDNDIDKLFLKAAEKKYSIAQYNLGDCYEIDRDEAKAFEWFEKVAENVVRIFFNKINLMTMQSLFVFRCNVFIIF
ncbi:hypothetical protein Glove_21g100 [Diversispora epigaea]|uniref:Protein kinase domain-containing protein n=1 Tax=Diversispora epigaea TaxID=1348612 RepID=A0A397JV31_9GLOM|nr:hypothetical protein Glove_21g100 [Diversispora epigaea]